MSTSEKRRDEKNKPNTGKVKKKESFECFEETEI